MEPTEHKEQKLFFKWCLNNAHLYPCLESIFAIPNGGNRDAITGRHLKDEGVRRGIPDMFLPVARGQYHGMFIEMKKRSGGVLSKEQKVWGNVLSKQGYKWICAKGFLEARDYVIEYYKA